MTPKARKVLALFADGEERDPVTLARSIGIRPKGRGNFSAAVTRLHDADFLSMRWTPDALYYRITPWGLRELGGKDRALQDAAPDGGA